MLMITAPSSDRIEISTPMPRMGIRTEKAFWSFLISPLFQEQYRSNVDPIMNPMPSIELDPMAPTVAESQTGGPSGFKRLFRAAPSPPPTIERTKTVAIKILSTLYNISSLPPPSFPR